MGLTAALVAITCGCTIRPFGTAASEERAQQLDRVQLRVMQFADEYVARIIGPLNALQLQSSDPRVRLDAQNWKLSQTTSAYTSASEPNPVDGALDMIVLAVLSRMVIEDENANPQSGLQSVQLQEAHEKLEGRAWELSAAVLDEQQKGQMQQAIREWRVANPNVRAVSLVHYRDLPQTIVPTATKGSPPRGLLAYIGIEPLRGIDPAVREIAETRQLAQRSIYYAQRVPALLDMQVERLTYQLALMPESRLLLADVNRVTDAAERVGRLADALPAAITQEREAAIAQIAGELNAQQGKTRALARDLRDLLAAGTQASDSVGATIRSLDALIVRLKPQGAAAEQTTAAGTEVKRSPVDAYAQALNELTRTSEELQRLIVTLDQSTGGVERLVTTTAAKTTSVLDAIVLRLFLFALALAAIVLSTALAYKVLSRRIAQGGM